MTVLEISYDQNGLKILLMKDLSERDNEIFKIIK